MCAEEKEYKDNQFLHQLVPSIRVPVSSFMLKCTNLLKKDKIKIPTKGDCRKTGDGALNAERYTQQFGS